MFVLPLLVSVLVQPALIVSTCLQLSLSHPHCLWQDHVVVYLLPPADVVQHGLVHPIVHHQVPHHAAAHLTPANHDLDSYFFSIAYSLPDYIRYLQMAQYQKPNIIWKLKNVEACFTHPAITFPHLNI